MKRLFTLLVLLLALCVSSCSYDDSAIWNKYNNLEERVTALEKLCGEMNTNIEALETLLEALNEGTTISDISEIKMDGKVIGYTISFSDDKEITIYHGKDGKDADNISGAIPEIGIAKDTDDIYYWTINGEWLLDKDGNKVSAQDCTGADGKDGKDGKDGITPRLKIEDGYWYVSYDGGDTWEEIGRATAEVDGDSGNGGCLFESVTYDNEYVYFTLSDGTTLALPRKKSSAVASERNKIYYTTTDGKKLFPQHSEPKYFGAIIVSNIYKDGIGVITFDDEVTLIGSSAFDGCSSLTSITIPDSVTAIGKYAFENCDSLTSITIPDSVTTIGWSAFDGCSSLTSITIPDSVTAIGGEAFYECSSLQSVTIGNSVTLIGERAFSSCDSLISITIPDSVTTIGDFAFDGCSSLTSVTIGDSVTEIGDYAFKYCSSLTEFKGEFASEDGRCLIIDGTLNSFAPAGVTEYTIPDSVTEIGKYAFENCSNLTSITIPDSVTAIGGSAFRYCSSLESVYCKPTTPPSIVYGVFDNNASGRKIYVPAESVAAYQTASYWSNYASSIVGYNFETGEVFEPTTPYNNQIWYTTTDGMELDLYNTTGFGANLIDNTYVDGKGVILFDGVVTEIGEKAFLACSRLTSITIPYSVTEIGYGAFGGCSSLTSITIPDSITTIGESAFASCSSLTSVTIPDGVTEIGDCAFLYCSSLTSITIPDGVTKIGEDAFNGCSNLTSITIPDSVTTIGEEAFRYCRSLTSITIPDSVTTIGNYAFSECSSLTSITIPDSVTEIGDSAFWGCSSLTSITIPDSVTEIGDSAFWGCSSLTSITIPDSVTEIGEVAFSVCSSLTEFKGKFASEDGRCLIIDGTLNSFAPAGVTEYTIPDGVTTIGYGAFAGFSSLTSVTIGNSVTAIGNFAFAYCSSLTSINIPDSVTTIGDDAFRYCDSLESVYCKPTTPPSIGYRVFNNNASDRKIYVPAESVAAYQTAESWSNYADSIVGYDF